MKNCKSCKIFSSSMRKLTNFHLFLSFSSALKWAIAAGRSDLLEKKLTSITKYYLCGEHFEDDSFLDPPQNTRLKKSLNPVNIPVPSIFKSNITKFMPKSKPSTSAGYAEDDDGGDDVEDDKKMNALCRIREGLTLECLSVFHDHYNYTEYNCASSFLNNVPDIPPNIGVNVDLGSTSIFPDDPMHSVDVNTLHVCRLCAENYASSENIVEISSDVYDRLNVLVSNTVS